MSLKTHSLLPIAAICAGVLAVPAVSSAVTLANYTFTGSLNSSDADANSTASALGFSGGTVDATQGLSAQGNVYFRATDLTTTITTAVPGNDYFTFTITPIAGSSYQLQDLKFTLGGADASNVAFNSQLALYSSLNGFSAQIGSTATQNTPASSSAATVWGAPTTIDLSAFGPIAAGTPVEFRLYAAISDVTSSLPANRILRVDDIQVNGSLVPEPSTTILGSIGLLALLRRKR